MSSDGKRLCGVVQGHLGQPGVTEQKYQGMSTQGSRSDVYASVPKRKIAKLGFYFEVDLSRNCMLFCV